ncbi:MAG: BrnT family toxin [Oligoflexia bacterium]|nr:BrnT family toxin [Oligoflexia bacterium]
MNMEFEWDNRKEKENITKHKVCFSEAVDSFFDPGGFKLMDTEHSNSEERFYWVGKTKDDRVLTTYFTIRGNKIRIIGSAEWRKFRRLYYETTKNK